MASICNDERASFDVMSGHGRLTLSLTGLTMTIAGLLPRGWRAALGAFSFE
jgi:hypothetical protein